MIEVLLLLLGSSVMMLRLGSGGSFPKPLKPAEEERYMRLWVEQKDMEARNILIERNLRLVAHVMKKYYTAGEDMDDLISIGTIGLIKGVNTYCPDKGVRFATYASRCIENAIPSPMGFANRGIRHLTDGRNLLDFHRTIVSCVEPKTAQCTMLPCLSIRFILQRLVSFRMPRNCTSSIRITQKSKPSPNGSGGAVIGLV